MKTLRYFGMAVVAAFAVARSAQAMDNAAVGEVLKLKNAGLGEDSIVAFIKNKNANYDLSADDAIQLKSQGVTSAVLTAMLNSGKGASAPPTPVVSAPQPAIPTAPTVPVAPTFAVPPTVPVAETVPTAQTIPSAGISADAAYFYNQLSPYGHWMLTEDNQWCWQPSVAVSTPSWRPYWDNGHWIYTDSGWYWASDYPWGWAAFHYGRWHLHPLHGWVWVPARVWGPAWVVWRSGGEYCGWAPLPPGAEFDVKIGGLLYHGAHVAVDFDFGLDWHHFNFCYVREMGEPMRAHFHKEAEIRAVYSQTTVLHNYTLKGGISESHTQPGVFNHGIAPERVAAARGGRTVETVTVHDLRAPAPNRGHERYDKDKKTLEVYRPRWEGGRN